jgi:copper homeostasis protein CutC
VEGGTTPSYGTIRRVRERVVTRLYPIIRPRSLHRDCNAGEYHASARTIVPNPLTYINTEVSDYGHVYVADEEEVRRMVSILRGER